MAETKVKDFKLSASERAALDRDGFLVRENVFDANECRAIAKDCETLATRVIDAAHGKKHVVGSYMFERQNDLAMYVKWEPDDPGVLQGIEPFAHLSRELADWGLDQRLVDPSRAICGQDDIVLYTEKLNLKRARSGGQYILHQDYPYWQSENPVAHKVATAMIFVDDATRENGCLEVAPGSHKQGVHKLRDVPGFGGLEMDPVQFDHSRLVALEVKAGSVVWFGAFLVHRSLPNRSDTDRRALLYSYQPAGHPHAADLVKQEIEAARAKAGYKDWIQS
jgi:ectoine hydroxylase-related dioxygenase (phytanoyl-CoA dioxygenase family)